MNNTAKGAIFLILSATVMALMSVIVKFTRGIPLFQQVFFRNLIMFLFAIFLVKKDKTVFWGHKGNRLLLFFRSFSGFLGVVASFYATRNLYLGDAQALLKISPFVVILLAVLFLKEKITKVNIITMVFAFLGALIIINPKFDSRLFPSLIGVLSAVFSGIAYTTISYISRKDNPEKASTILFLFGLYSMLFSLPFMIANFVIPTPTQLIYLISIGVTASIGQFLLTSAYGLTDASKISIFDYVGPIASVFFGWYFFDEVLPINSFIGIGIIILAGFISYLNSRKESLKA